MMFLTSSEESPYKNGFLEKSGKFVDFEKKIRGHVSTGRRPGLRPGFLQWARVVQVEGKVSPRVALLCEREKYVALKAVSPSPSSPCCRKQEWHLVGRCVTREEKGITTVLHIALIFSPRMCSLRLRQFFWETVEG